MAKMKVLDLFSGTGGFSLGLERTGGFETVAFCEIDQFCQKVLKKHWPDVPIYDDVRKLNYGEHVDLVTAGFPCQDISFAGAGAGLTGTRSRLFWRILRTAGMVGRPKLLLENVAGLLARGLSEVLGALAQIGYDTEWHCISASAVGAPHQRDRVFIFADAERFGQQRSWECLTSIHKTPDAFREASGLVDAVREGSLPYVCGRHDGVSQAVDQNRALGNTIVPQIAEQWGNAILKVNHLLTSNQ